MNKTRLKRLATVLWSLGLSLGLAAAVYAAAGTAQPQGLAMTRRPSEQQAPAAFGTSAVITEYMLPVDVAGIMTGTNGDLWFSSYFGNAIGKLVPSTGQTSIYSRSTSGTVGDTVSDPQANVWYRAVSPSRIGRLTPATNTFTEWPIDGELFSLAIDPSSGDMWFPSNYYQEQGIYRLSPATNSLTRWVTLPTNFLYDVRVDDTGMVWVTAFDVAGTAGVLRLDPATDSITAWAMPAPTGYPVSIFLSSSDDIWFTEVAGSNSIVQLTPSTNTAKEFWIPTPSSDPSRLAVLSNTVWFGNEYGLGKLLSTSGTPTITVLSPQTATIPKTITVSTPMSYVVVPQLSVASTSSRLVIGTISGAFTEYPLPSPAFTWDVLIHPHGNEVWYSRSRANRIGRLQETSVPISDVFLPSVQK